MSDAIELTDFEVTSNDENKPTKMDPEAKRVWLEALRSGQYRQAKARLVSDGQDSFCCLGVLCDVTNRGKWENSSFGPFYVVAGEDSQELLPAGLALELRLPIDTQSRLAEWNDAGMTFEAIANWVERNL